ncbi:hypothetical protein E3N88_35234 [Mikania micrantha]|uniref:Uncharacterized protein n=1 Tax=Mikania micrantha TaxID=192012 RepID=A0A5N6M0D3_9ASTR|nr:hypothetical protein E3N88_35234 [Mikania micrantha]
MQKYLLLAIPKAEASREFITLGRGRGGNVVLPAAVGQNLSTAVKGVASAYDGLNDLNHIMDMNDGQQLTVKFLHRMNDVMMICRASYDKDMMARGMT